MMYTWFPNNKYILHVAVKFITTFIMQPIFFSMRASVGDERAVLTVFKQFPI